MIELGESNIKRTVNFKFLYLVQNLSIRTMCTTISNTYSLNNFCKSTKKQKDEIMSMKCPKNMLTDFKYILKLQSSVKSFKIIVKADKYINGVYEFQFIRKISEMLTFSFLDRN